MKNKKAKVAHPPVSLNEALSADSEDFDKILTPEQERVLVRAYKGKKDSRALDKLWKSHQGWIIKTVSHFAKKAPYLDRADLEQEALIGFAKGVKKFKEEKGFGLMTYAQWWVRQEVQMFIKSNRTLQKIPGNIPPKMRDPAKKFLTLKTAFEEAGKQWPPSGAAQAAFEKETGKPFHEVQSFLTSFYQNATSMNAPMGGAEDDRVLGDRLESRTPDAMTLLMQKSNKEALVWALAQLDKRSVDVLCRRYGLLNGGEEETLQDVADVYDLSRERVRQIQSAAEGKLRDILQSQMSVDGFDEYQKDNSPEFKL